MCKFVASSVDVSDLDFSCGAVHGCQSDVPLDMSVATIFNHFH